MAEGTCGGGGGGEALGSNSLSVVQGPQKTRRSDTQGPRAEHRIRHQRHCLALSLCTADPSPQDRLLPRECADPGGAAGGRVRSTGRQALRHGRGKILVRGSFRWGKVAPRGIPPTLPCVTHALTCRPTPRSEADRFANAMATERSISSQHLKESAVPNACPKDYGPAECSAIGIFTAPPTPPHFRRGDFSPSSLHFPRSVPPPVRRRDSNPPTAGLRHPHTDPRT